MAGKFILSEELKWHTERPDGFVVAVFEWYNGIETETTYGIYDPREKEWTDGNCGVMVTPDRWVDINTYIETTRAELAAKDAEVERLRVVVEKMVAFGEIWGAEGTLSETEAELFDAAQDALEGK